MASDMHGLHRSGHLPLTQVMCLYYTYIGLSPPLTYCKYISDNVIKSSLSLSIYIYINHCPCVEADYVPHGPERFLIGLNVKCLRTEVHQEPLVKLYTTCCDLHHLMPLAPIQCLLSHLMTSAPLWTITTLQLICSPSTSPTLGSC